MLALVTGAAGFVGGHLLPALARAGYEVRGSDREIDVSDAGAVDAQLAELRPALVVHLAAVSAVSESRRDPRAAFHVNFAGSRCVLEAMARRAPDARLLLVGSGDQYGVAEPGAAPFREGDPLRPVSPYARTKAAADLLAARYAADGLDVVRVRAFNHTGPGQDDRFVLPSFARQAAEIAAGKREPLLRVGNLDSQRDFLDVEDVVAAYVALAERRVPAGVYNVASGRAVRVGSALDRLLELFAVQPRIEVDPARHRPTDLAAGDATRLRRATAWEPRVSFDTTLARLVEHWRERIRVS
ncbi:MAG: GDP-mannose 4,6-dehydratase [Myxococcota bacterium]|nr:GDP-mannose 4,6-dehydratase [Myxococcota bacterium]